MNMLSATLLTALVFLPSTVASQENYATAWSGHRYVIVNTATTGITTPVVRFPLLVRLDTNHAAIFAESRAGGADLRFTNVDDVTRLQHQIESWDSAGRTAAVWVLADTLQPGRSNVAFRMHWGNPAAVDSASGARVFDTAHAFQAVWHMAGDGDESDATGNGFTAVQNGAPLSVPAVIGSGRAVSAGNYFRAAGTADGTLNFPEGSRYTISAWVNTATMPGHGTILSKHDNAYALKLNSDGFNWEFFEYGTDLTAAGWNWVNAPTFDDAGVWRLITGVRTDIDLALYVDGVRMDGGFSTSASSSARVLDRDVVIGAQPAGSNTEVQRAFDGVLDEVRMANTERHPDWIRLEYETQKPGVTIVSLMDTVPTALASSPRARASHADVAVRVSRVGDGLRFDLAGFASEDLTRARYVVRTLRGDLVVDRTVAVRDGGFVWDARGPSGRLVPQGAYSVRISVPGSTAPALQRTVTLTR